MMHLKSDSTAQNFKIIFIVAILMTVLGPDQVKATRDRVSVFFDQLVPLECFCLEEIQSRSANGSVYIECKAFYRQRTVPVIEWIGLSGEKYEISGWNQIKKIMETMKVLTLDGQRCLRYTSLKGGRGGVKPRE